MCSALKWLLFLIWPVLAVVFLFSATIICAVAWFLIPFGRVVMNDTKWSLRFPWSKG